MLSATKLLRRYRDDARGIAAIEFAMILPMMFLMFFGMIDLSNGFAADRKVSQIAQMLSDLTSRNAVVGDTDIANFRMIANAMLTPYDKTMMSATITQVYLDPTSKTAKVVWSRGDAKLSKGTTVTLSTNLVAKDSTGKWLDNQYLILGSVTFTYKPIIGWVVASTGVALSEQAYTKPRQTTCVMYDTTCTPTGG